MTEIIMLVVFAVVIAIFVYRSADNETWETEKRVKREAKRKLNQSRTSDKDQIDRPFNRHTKNYAQNNKHAAVTIAHDIEACDAVKSVGNIRFLVRDAPLLPLKGCTQSSNCECQYLHHTDRRKVDRRDNFIDNKNLGENQRTTPRRTDDKFKDKNIAMR